MLDKKNFFINLSITQGRHLKIMNNQIQLFPEKSWKKELKIFKKTKLKYIEWVISKDNFDKNPLCQINGHRVINKNLKKNKVSCRSVDLDFIIKENLFILSKKKREKLLDTILVIAKNCEIVGIKYLIFPFLETSSPNNYSKISKLIFFLKKLKEKISSKVILLIETDLSPKKTLNLIYKLKNKIFINYDIGNSASNNFNFDEEKRYFKYVKNIHLKDRVKFGNTVRFGKGNANFIRMFEFLKNNKIKCDFNLQPARSNCNKDIDEIKINLKYIKKIIHKI